MKNLEELKWYFYRARAMSIGELILRVKRSARLRRLAKALPEGASVLKVGTEKPINPGRLSDRFRSVWDFGLIDAPAEPGKYRVYEREIDLTRDIPWLGFNSEKWPKDKPAWKIKFTGQDHLGEIREVWELNRMQFMPRMALFALKNDDARTYDNLKAIFYDWVRENPFLYGANWSSPMESAIRAYQWLTTLALLEFFDKRDDEFSADLLRGVVASMEYVVDNFSAYSSANNHLIAEAALTGIAGLMLEGRYEQNWHETGSRILEKELKKQFYDDGVNKEHATHYQVFVSDIWLQFNLISAGYGKSPVLPELLEKSMFFLSRLKIGDNFIEYGDSDDGKLLKLLPREGEYFDEVLELSEIAMNVENSRSFWRPRRILRDMELRDCRSSQINCFAESGYFVFNDGQICFLFDFAPLGYGKLAAHGHSDCLQFILYDKNGPIFTDGGTYVYNADAELRNYFKGTRAHNTLAYKDRDQSQALGAFIYGRRAKARGLSFRVGEKGFEIEAEHNGYRPWKHMRKIRWEFNGNAAHIVDFFPRKADVCFHAAPAAQIERIDSNTIAVNDSAKVVFSNPYREYSSWTSDRFLNKKRRSSFEIEMTHIMITDIYFEPEGAAVNARQEKGPELLLELQK